jgi:hypothetical protein
MDCQLFMLELTASPQIWRVAHTQAYTSLDWDGEKNYFAEAFAAINTAGTKIYWGSNWRNYTTDYTDAYEVILPTNWSSDLTNIEEHGSLPSELRIDVYPNPFNSSVKISVETRHASSLQIEIYDIAGKLVGTPCGTNAPLSPLSRGTDTNAKHEGQGVYVWRPAPSVPSGVYLVRAKIGNSEIAKRIVYLK